MIISYSKTYFKPKIIFKLTIILLVLILNFTLQYSVNTMPRCFLAKKSASINGHWLGPEDVTNNNHHENVAATATMLAGTHGSSVSHRSTIGSISAAKAVLSIQEPILSVAWIFWCRYLSLASLLNISIVRVFRFWYSGSLGS